jgi:hypothetical protein
VTLAHYCHSTPYWASVEALYALNSPRDARPPPARQVVSARRLWPPEDLLERNRWRGGGRGRERGGGSAHVRKRDATCHSSGCNHLDSEFCVQTPNQSHMSKHPDIYIYIISLYIYIYIYIYIKALRSGPAGGPAAAGALRARRLPLVPARCRAPHRARCVSLCARASSFSHAPRPPTQSRLRRG